MMGEPMLSFRVPQRVLDAINRASEREERTRSNWCLKALREALVRDGYLPRPKLPRKRG